MKIKGAIFDMDGTLVNSLTFWKNFWPKFGKDFLGIDDFKPSEEVDKHVRTTTWAQASEFLLKTYQVDRPTSDLITYADDQMYDFYENHAHLKEGAKEFLDALKSRGVKMAIASASTLKHVVFALKCYGVYDYFDTVLSCAEIGVGKDKPDIYYLAQKTLGCEVEKSCVFEDSALALQTAKNAGFRTVGIFDPYNFDHDKLKALSDIYVDDGETMKKLIPLISADE